MSSLYFQPQYTKGGPVCHIYHVRTIISGSFPAKRHHKPITNRNKITRFQLNLNELSELVFEFKNIFNQESQSYQSGSLTQALKAEFSVMKSLVDVLMPLCSSNHELTRWTFRIVSVRPLFLFLCFPLQRCSLYSLIQTPFFPIQSLNQRVFWGFAGRGGIKKGRSGAKKDVRICCRIKNGSTTRILQYSTEYISHIFILFLFINGEGWGSGILGDVFVFTCPKIS